MLEVKPLQLQRDPTCPSVFLKSKQILIGSVPKIWRGNGSENPARHPANRRGTQANASPGSCKDPHPTSGSDTAARPQHFLQDMSNTLPPSCNSWRKFSFSSLMFYKGSTKLLTETATGWDSVVNVFVPTLPSPFGAICLTTRT